jgi:hypothetical protein
MYVVNSKQNNRPLITNLTHNQMWHPAVSTQDGEKTYSSDEFRGCWSSNMPHDQPRRHIFDCELAAAAAAYTRGPRMSDETVGEIRSLMATGNNCHYYGTDTANGSDRVAANSVLQSAYSGERAVLPPHQAAHIRAGAEWLRANRDELPDGFVRSAARLYENVYDESGRKVVDGRWFRGMH